VLNFPTHSFPPPDGLVLFLCAVSNFCRRMGLPTFAGVVFPGFSITVATFASDLPKALRCFLGAGPLPSGALAYVNTLWYFDRRFIHAPNLLGKFLVWLLRIPCAGGYLVFPPYRSFKPCLPFLPTTTFPVVFGACASHYRHASPLTF